MRRRNETDGEARRASRSAAVLPLAAAITSALALTGAAFYTVDRSACDPAQYVRHDNHLELVGGCLDQSTLDRMRATHSPAAGQIAEYNNYRP